MRMKLSLILIFSLLANLTSALAQENHWVGTWGCGIQLVEPRNLPPVPGLSSNTLRQIVHSTIGGKQLRLRFSNVFGTAAVEMKSVHIALSPGAVTSSTIDPATDKALKFAGAEFVSIPAGKDVWSDPVSFDLPALTNLAISIYFGQTSRDITGHPSSRCDSYILPGNAVTSASMQGAIKTEHWYNIEDIDVMADNSYGALVTFGDSITDGRGSTTGHNDRWPDDLAVRLHTNAPTARVSVINTGIGGNAIFGGLGPAGVKRFHRDVLDQSGVRWVVIFEAVNDIGSARGEQATLATNLIAAYKEFATEAHDHNIRIYGATITPFGGSGYDSPQHEEIRQDVNAWIRTNSFFDGVIDFDAAVRDPATPNKFKAEYHPGRYANDWLHLNAVGYQTMANAINLNLFSK
jgi:lysophospholipase L1-like esterase